MSDHFSGPRAIADPAADIADLYVFPSPERPGYLVLVMTVFPAAAPSALFSDAVAYRFRLRPVTVATAGARPLFEVGQTEYAFSCTFAAPVKPDGSEAWVQTGTCTTPTGEVISFRVNDERGTEAKGLRVFAGLRLDPFFIDLPGVQATEKLRRLAFKAKGDNVLEGQNVLTIVVEAEVAALFGAGSGPLFAVAGETVTTGKVPIRLERIGRPELKNVVMSSKGVRPGEPRPRDSGFVQPGRPVPSGSALRRSLSRPAERQSGLLRRPRRQDRLAAGRAWQPPPDRTAAGRLPGG